MVTTFDLNDYVYDALPIGASAFVLEHSPPAELARAVRVLAAGRAILDLSVTRRLVEAFVKARPAPPRVAPALLTPRELDVLVKVARGCPTATSHPGSWSASRP
jgi:DNA-binding NarL/FixJ family response regulator